MWNPFKRKKPAPNAGLPRNAAGQFSAANVPDNGKQLDADTRKMGAMAENLRAMNETIREIRNFQVEDSMDEAADVIESAGDSGLLGVLAQVMPFIAPALLPYVPGLIEKYTGVRPDARYMPTSSGLPSTSGGTSPGGMVPLPQDGNSSAQLKAALALPDAMWTKQNVKQVLGQYGLQLDDNDIKRLAQKLSKAK